ncbi:hypothetical protein DITRI_Ditri10aG0034100 [Diplodiscus trichospermus]
MVDKYGPIFTIKLGVRRALVVSSCETVKECLTTNDKAFATRPNLTASKLIWYDGAMMGVTLYGPYWRQIRKFATLKLLSNNCLDMLKHVRESEIKFSLQELYQEWNKTKNSFNKVLAKMKRWFCDLPLNLILRMIVGKRIPSSSNDVESKRLKKALTEFVELSGKLVVSNALPFMRWFDIGGNEKAMKKVGKELDWFAEGWLEEHKRKKASGDIKWDEDFMDVMLSTLTDVGQNPDITNKATCLGLTIAASDTTVVTLTWALSLLLNNRHVLKKAQEELDIHVGKDKLVEESDIKKLVYLQGIVKETLRLYPAAPLLLPHASMEDCIVNGYHILAGTRLFINAHKLHRDPRVWSDPCKFQPERFLTTHKDIDVKGQNFELIPFGSGRRMCPGVSFALQVLELTVASLLQGFEFGMLLDKPVDMTEGFGSTNMKALPLQVYLTPRLPAFCYI